MLNVLVEGNLIDNKTATMDNSIFKYRGVTFDPVNGSETIIIERLWVNHYKRKKNLIYGISKQTIGLEISRDIPTTKDKSDEFRKDYLEKYWLSFLIYGLKESYKDSINIIESEIIHEPPKWKSIEEYKTELNIPKDIDLIEVSPYREGEVNFFQE